MKHDVICAWLGLAPENWPPDHYALLGLERRETDAARIEQAVHQRLARLRCYQITHPEQATEAMNLLAKAFMCLTDPMAKQTYDAGLLLGTSSAAASIALVPASQKAAVPGVVFVPSAAGAITDSNAGLRTPSPRAALADTAVGSGPVTQVDWKANVAPPPVRIPSPPAGEVPAATVPAEVNGSLVSNATPVVDLPQQAAEAEAKPAGQLLGTPRPQRLRPELTSSGPLAGYKGFSPALLRSLTCRRGLGTKQELYKRVRKTRRLLYAWERAGKFLGKPKRQVKLPVEEKEFSRALAALAKHLQGFPRMLGQPGQPGYRVAARARMPLDVERFNALDGEHRELLARDWAAGQTLLSSHRQFLRQELRAVHHLNWWRLGMRAFLNDFPVKTVLFLAALVVALIVFHVVTP
jgi:hypothetical protein